MSLQTLIPVVLQASVLLSVFAIGLKASVYDATYLFRRPGELARALLAMNVAVPLFAVVLISIFDLTPAVRIALVALSVSPIPPLLPNKMVKAGGTDGYAIGLLIAAGLLAIIFVPLAIEVVERVRNVTLEMSMGSIARLVFMTILLPLGLGVGVPRPRRGTPPPASPSSRSRLLCWSVPDRSHRSVGNASVHTSGAAGDAAEGDSPWRGEAAVLKTTRTSCSEGA